MITNVPTWEDLQTISLQLYFKAWANAVEIITEFDEVYPEGTDWKEEWESYVAAAQSDLQSVYTLIQQSQEIGIKALIARVSPFLLLKRPEAKASAPDGAYDFSDFQTIDASELVRVHNIFCDAKLSDDFARDFETLRRERNKIAHIGLFNRTLTPEDLVDLLIKQYQQLYPGRAWLVDNVTFVSKRRWADIGDYDEWSPVGQTLYELWKILPRVTPAQFEVILGHSYDEERMICPDCGHALERFTDGSEPYAADVPTAYQTEAEKMACVACAETFSLIAKRCDPENCDGTFAAVADGSIFCVTCGEEAPAS